MKRTNRIQFMRRRNQIEFFVHFKADKSLKCLQYGPYVYHVVYQCICAFHLIFMFGVTFDNEGSEKT